MYILFNPHNKRHLQYYRDYCILDFYLLKGSCIVATTSLACQFVTDSIWHLSVGLLKFSLHPKTKAKAVEHVTYHKKDVKKQTATTEMELSYCLSLMKLKM